MRFYIIIPAHNEEQFIGKTLSSLVEQSYLPEKILVVNDNSTDNTQTIINSFAEKHDIISSISLVSEGSHQPGSKVVEAFKRGKAKLDNEFDIICKYDADLIFPTDYLQNLKDIFLENPRCGIAGGFCYIQKDDNWILENLTNKDHVRGALKAYRKECFEEIGGLKSTMGWDTVDELLAQYHDWKIITEDSLQVKHLKPTGATYSSKAKYKQGEAFYKLRYGKSLTRIASLKLALRKNDLGYYWDCMRGYKLAKKNNVNFIVSEKEGHFIRDLRWKKIKNKLRLSSNS